MNHSPTKSDTNSSHPHPNKDQPSLRLVAWETTRNCNLACVHCRASATKGPHSGELDTADVRDYFKLLLDHNLLKPDDKPVLSVEVRPLLAEESSELIIANAKRVIKEAWASL